MCTTRDARQLVLELAQNNSMVMGMSISSSVRSCDTDACPTPTIIHDLGLPWQICLSIHLDIVRIEYFTMNPGQNKPVVGN